MFAPLKRNLFANINYKSHKYREFWAWLNIMFNLVDKERIKDIGPDRACAEWIIRNGGKVTFMGGTPSSDFNAIANLGKGVHLTLVEVDASETSIIERGFEHFKDCKNVRSIKFHKNQYLTDSALTKLGYVSQSLDTLHVSNCPAVTDKGIVSLCQLKKLNSLTLRYLEGVRDWNKCEAELRKCLSGNIDIG